MLTVLPLSIFKALSGRVFYGWVILPMTAITIGAAFLKSLYFARRSGGLALPGADVVGNA